MISEEKLFGNYFDDIRITSTRLAAFATDTHNKFIAEDTANLFNPLRQELETAADALAKELSDISGGLGKQKGKTQTVDEVMASFKTVMSDMEGVIAHSVGGFKSAAFIEFYPNGVDEYSSATKTNAATLMQRVSDMADAHSQELTPPLRQQLNSFIRDWNAARDAQQQQMGDVSGGRQDRSSARVALELVLLKLIHMVAGNFPGNLEACSRYFAFHLLDASRHKSLEHGDGGSIVTGNTD